MIRRNPLRFATLSATVLLLAGAAPAWAADAAGSGPAPATFTLSAEGEVAVAPDIANLQMGVTAQGKTAAEAMKLNRERMSAAVAALKAAGVEGKDIQTSGLNLNAQYAYAPNVAPKLTGYEASHTLSATVRDIAKTGAVIDSVTAAGANQINGISFDVADRRRAEDAARRAAVKALSDKAALYAEATGLHILRLASLSEGGGYVQPPMPRLTAVASMKMADSAPTPVEAGELKVRITINAVYELTR